MSRVICLFIYLVTNVISTYTGWVAWQWCHFLLAFNTIQATINQVCHITLNQTLSHKFESGVNSQVALKWNCAKRNRLKRDVPVYSVWKMHFLGVNSNWCILQLMYLILYMFDIQSIKQFAITVYYYSVFEVNVISKQSSATIL